MLENLCRVALPVKQRITNRRFDDPFKLELMVKDIGIAMELAKRKGLPVPLSVVGQELWREAERYSERGSSIINMVRWVERMANTQII
jgi:3-hydroxyisobutyrate dehydrogenase